MILKDGEFEERMMRFIATVDFYMSQLFKLQQELIERTEKSGEAKEFLHEIVMLLGKAIAGVESTKPMPDSVEGWYERSKAYREQYDSLERAANQRLNRKRGGSVVIIPGAWHHAAKNRKKK